MSKSNAKKIVMNNVMSRTTNNVYTIWTVSSMMGIATQAVQIFQNLYGYNFVVEEITMDAIEDRLENYVDISDLPDLLLVHDSYLQKYIRQYPNLFMDLYGVLDFSIYNNAKIMNVSLNGVPYGCPCTCEPVALYYNKYFADNYEISINENTTWDEFIEIGRTLKENEGIYLLPPAKYLTEVLMRATGNLYYDENGNISSAGVLEVLELVETLSEERLLYPDDTIPYEEIAVKIINGEIFSVIGGPYLFSRIKTLSAERGVVYDFAVSKTPKNNDLMYEADLGGFSWLVMNRGNSETPQAVIDFLTIMFNQNNNEIRALFSNVLISCDLVPCVSFFQDILVSLNNGCFVAPPVIKFLVEISMDVPEIYYGIYAQDLTEALTNIFIEISNGIITSSQGMSNFNGICVDYGMIQPSLVVDHIVIDQAPNKTEYYSYECFENTGMIVHAYYQDGTHEIIEGYVYSPTILTTMDTSVTVSYSSGGVTATATQTVTVCNRTLDYITATARRIFLHGDDIDTSAFNVTAHYDVGPTRTVTATNVYPETLSDEDIQYITVGYGNKSTSIAIDVNRKLERIEIITNPNKMSYYKGERFNRTGMSVRATYTNGEIETISSGRLSVNPSVVKFKDEQELTTITVSYTERSVIKEDVLTVYKKKGTDLDDCEISQDMTESGYGTVNLSTGKIRYAFADYVSNDSVIPITISHVYNQDTGNVCYVGNNWRLNIQQEIVNVNGQWKYTDKNGKQYIFDEGYEISSGRSAIRNEKLGFDLFEIAAENVIYLIDRNNNTLVFKQINSRYRLISMHIYPSTMANPIDAYSLSITHDTSGRITRVTSGKQIGEVRPYIDFIYENNLLSKLKYTQSGTSVIAKYSYNNDNLSKIELCHSNIDSNYSRVTEFQYNEFGFIVKDLSSKNANEVVKSLTYSLDNLYRVNQINIGYGVTEQDITSINYSANGVGTEINTNVSLTTLVKNNGTVSVYSFNSFGVLSQYSYEIENDSYDKPKKINSEQSCGFNYKSLAGTFSDTLDVYHDDFETDICDWVGATLTNSKAVYGEQSIRGTNLYKTYVLSSTVISNSSTIYLSLWVLGNNSNSEIIISVDINSDTETWTLEHKVDKNLPDKWQYVVLCLGKRKIGDTITVTVESSTVYVDEVRLTRLPYETPENIADTTYNDFGNITKFYKYNPISEIVEYTEYTYNSNHQLTEEKTFATNLKNKTQNTYNDNGLLTQKKSYGASSNYLMEQNIYNSDNHVLTSSLDTDNVVTCYGDGVNYETVTIVGETNSPNISQRNEYFNNSGIVKNIISGQMQNNFKYLTDGNLDKIKFNHTDSSYNSEYAFEYDTFGNLKSLKIGATAIVSLEYDYKHLNKETYANNDTVEYEYDIKDRTVSIKENNTIVVSIDYSDNENDLVTVTHSNGPTYTSKAINKNSVTNEYKVVYPNLDRILKVVGYATNNQGNISSARYFVDNSATPFETIVYTKDSLGQLSSLERTGHGGNTYYTYDSLYKLSKKETVYTVNSTTKKYTVDYEYNSIDNVRKGTRITKESFSVGFTNNGDIEYEYYRNGNIAKVKENDTVKVEYSYDEYDRLVWEYNYILLRAYKYSYDNGGNIIKKKPISYPVATFQAHLCEQIITIMIL
ncbi:MAG: carbohydrate ABC transporter substrate-binding protein [Clostridia bacterium]|nr:carbohydrate ABC transporter substrate-binding protein [Clostridia bacterium]